jgi:hypothetical protein
MRLCKGYASLRSLCPDREAGLIMRGKPTNRVRILRLLDETAGLSNLRIRTLLNLSEENYVKVREELLQDRLVEKYVCKGGGILISKQFRRRQWNLSVPRAPVSSFPTPMF